MISMIEQEFEPEKLLLLLLLLLLQATPCRHQEACEE
jgi:hypothetical protein